MRDEKKVSFIQNACRQVNVILMLLVLVFRIVKVEPTGFIYPLFGLSFIITTSFICSTNLKKELLDTLIFAVIFIILLLYLF